MHLRGRIDPGVAYGRWDPSVGHEHQVPHPVGVVGVASQGVPKGRTAVPLLAESDQDARREPIHHHIHEAYGPEYQPGAGARLLPKD